jgi:hypothetical protein
MMPRHRFVNGVNLLPATGEFTYGTTPRRGQRDEHWRLGESA